VHEKRLTFPTGVSVPLLEFIVARLREPSTYAGLGALLAAAGIHVNDLVVQALIQVLISVAGLVAMMMPEKAI
jgi:hypothetical protein